MNRRPPPFSRPARFALLLAIVVLVVSPAPSRAGLGDFVKKAKDKAAQAVGKKTEAQAPEGDCKVVFDDVTVEMDDARLDKMIATWKLTQAKNAGRAELVAKLDKQSSEREAILDKNQKQIERDRNKRSDLESCYHDGYHQANDQRAKEYSQKALTDPTIREKFTKAAAKYNEAAARGDSTAIAKLNQILANEIMATAQDSADVRAKCGALPPKSAAEAKVDELDKQIAATQEEIRKADEKAADEQAKASDLTPQQLGMVLERIQMYLGMKPVKSGRSGKSGKAGESGSGSSSSGSSSSGSSSSSDANDRRLRCTFSAKELAALEKHEDQLREMSH